MFLSTVPSDGSSSAADVVFEELMIRGVYPASDIPVTSGAITICASRLVA